MALFSTENRQEIMDFITEFMQQNEHIAALIAVGSGSYGYNDELSDLDMVVAVDGYENIDAVKEYIRSRLEEKLKFIYFKQPPNTPMQVYLTDNFLEIDIGFGAYRDAAAFNKNWKVLFDKTGTVAEAMQKSADKAENMPNTEKYNKKLAEVSDRVWHNLMHTAVAIKRGQYWRAFTELNIVRDMLIELLGIRYFLDMGRGKETDKLPAEELTLLKKTLVTDFSPATLWLCLDALTDAVYTELEHYGEQTCIPINRRQVEEYIAACKKL